MRKSVCSFYGKTVSEWTVLISFVLASCSTQKDLVKRKYNPGYYVESFSSDSKPPIQNWRTKENMHNMNPVGLSFSAITSSPKTSSTTVKKINAVNYNLFSLKQQTAVLPIDTPQKEPRSSDEFKSFLKELFMDPLKEEIPTDTLRTKMDYITPKKKVTEPYSIATFILGVVSGIVLWSTWNVLTLGLLNILLLAGTMGIIVGLISLFRFKKYPKVYKGKLWVIIGYLSATIVFCLALLFVVFWNWSFSFSFI